MCRRQLYWGVRLEAFVAVKSTEEDCLKIIYIEVTIQENGPVEDKILSAELEHYFSTGLPVPLCLKPTE